MFDKLILIENEMHNVWDELFDKPINLFFFLSKDTMLMFKIQMKTENTLSHFGII